MLRDILDALPDAILAFDKQDRLLFTNVAYARMFPDNAPFMVPGRSMEELVRVGMDLGIYRDIGETEAEREAWLARYLTVHRNPGPPRLLPLLDGRIVQAREVHSAAGNLVAVRTDVTRLQQAEAVIRRQAEFDQLTDLLNRTALLDRLAAELKARRAGDVSGGAFVLMDIDHFKTINDTFGLDVGDCLLIEMARRLQRYTRRGDTVARLGSDEFGMLLPFSGLLDDARDGYVPTLARLLLRLSEPVELSGRRLVPSVSMGVALYPLDGDDEQVLLKHANLALFEAKRRGRGRWSRFDPDASSLRSRRQELAAELRVALAEGRLEAAMQPKLHLRDLSHAGFEVLARWTHDGKPVRPDVFIPVAEETGLIVPLGRAILALALGAARAMLDRGLDPGVIAVNAAALQLTSDDFVEEVAQALRHHDLPASRLEIEVTETVLLDRSAEMIERSLRSLRALGVRLALDDFGTGYASLVHLRRFPVQRLKIDKSFVMGMGEGSDSGVIVKAIISLAHGLGLDVVAEGVETQAQLDYLRLIGCDDVQGYLIARPLPMDQVANYLVEFATRAPSGDCVWAGIAGD